MKATAHPSASSARYDPGIIEGIASGRLDPLAQDAHDAYFHYIELSPLAQPHTLSLEGLIEDGTALSRSIKPIQGLAAVSCQSELAQLLQWQHQPMSAKRVLLSSLIQNTEVTSQVGCYPDHEDFVARTAAALAQQVRVAQQFVTASKPRAGAALQRRAYRAWHTHTAPVIGALHSRTARKGPEARMSFGAFRDQLIVLQTLNRLQADAPSAHWSVTTANQRENPVVIPDYATETMRQQTFDVRLTFADQTFIPLKTAEQADSLPVDPNIGVVPMAEITPISQQRWRLLEALGKDSVGERLETDERRLLARANEVVLGAIASRPPIGESMYGPKHDATYLSEAAYEGFGQRL